MKMPKMPKLPNIKIWESEEFKDKCKTNWILTLSLMMITSGLAIATSEAYLLNNGVQDLDWDEYGFSGVSNISGWKIGYGLTFAQTGLMGLMLKAKKKRWLSFIAFALSITSFAFASLLVCKSYYTATQLNFAENLGQMYDWTTNSILESSLADSEGHLLYPLFPWTFLVLLMGTFPYFAFSASIGMIFMMLHMNIDLTEINSEYPKFETKSRKAVYKINGVITLICGLCLNLAFILLANSNYNFYSQFVNFWTIGQSLPCAIASLILCAMIALFNAGNKSLMSRLASGLIALVTIGGIIFLLVLMLSRPPPSYIWEEEFEKMGQDKPIDSYVFKNVKETESMICIGGQAFYDHEVQQNNYDYGNYYGYDTTTKKSTSDGKCPTYCIPINKKCDGVLDFFSMINANGTYVENDDCKLTYTEKMADEITCGRKWFGIYLSIYAASAIGLINCLVLFILSCPAWKYLLKFIFKYACSMFSNFKTYSSLK